MNFIVRSARDDDSEGLYDLARQFSLLNLPADKNHIRQKIEKSIASFAGELPDEECNYLFVLEDLESQWLAGCSQIKAKHGTKSNPTYSFKILKKERFSKDLGIGFIHQILRLKICSDGPTEIGGLVVDKSYRRRPEKVGKIISLMRFIYIGMRREKFQRELHSEMAPPLTETGKSEFWEALGRRFTGMPYQEADQLSHQNKEFIRSLFPEEDIYLCLLDAQARLVLGRVAQETQGALHMLQKIGFKYKNEVDPFDGGPHLTVMRDKVSLIEKGSWAHVVAKEVKQFEKWVLLGYESDSGFMGGATFVHFEAPDQVVLPPRTMEILKIPVGAKVFISPYS